MGTKLITRFDWSEIKRETIESALEGINAKLSKLAVDIAVSETERQEKIVMMEMAKHYLELRRTADEVFEAAKHPFRQRKRLKKALDAYAKERILTVVVEPKPLTEYISGERVLN